ncbi:MAG TPA: inositol monophosphatase family protein [Solirubrobacterales bacterium]|nr:inositol monophosphatase family protein [Solirubrobacterales bacterium]
MLELRSVVLDLATALREEVAPELGQHAGRKHSGAGAGGDVTFAIDERAEAFMEQFLAERAPEVAFYSEDRGLVTPAGDPEWVLIVDPIDGTRPAMAGFEAACVSVALAPLGDGDPTIGDVTIGCVVEIKSGQAFVAERGKGLDPAPALSSNTELSRMFWAYGLRGRPVRRIAEVVGELIDASSVGGGTFDLGSATFDMTRVVTGQLDAYVEPGARLIAEIPGMREEFERVGGGVVLNNSPYDVAAAILICEEAGAVVTDAWGGPLGAYPMLGSGAEYQLSCVTAATAELHARIVTEIDAGIDRLARALV